MHIATLVYVDKVAVARVEDEVAPRHALHLAREREVFVPAEGLVHIEGRPVIAAILAIAVVYKGVVVDILVAQLAEAVAARLVLHHATRVERITVGAKRTEGYGCTAGPHLRHAAILGGVGHHDDERLVQVFLGHRGCVKGVGKYLVIVGLQLHATRKGGVEAVVAYGVHRAHAAFGREGEGRVNIKIATVGGVRLQTEEILHLLLHGLEIAAIGNALCVVAIAQQHNVDAAFLALGGLLQGEPLVFAIRVAILAYAALVGILFFFQAEHHLALTAGSVFGHGIDGERNLCLLVATRGRYLAPVGLAGHLPFALGIHYKTLLMFCGQGASDRGAAH